MQYALWAAALYDLQAMWEVVGTQWPSGKLYDIQLVSPLAPTPPPCAGMWGYKPISLFIILNCEGTVMRLHAGGGEVNDKQCANL